MIDLCSFLAQVTATRGISGDELPAAQVVAEAFKPLSDTVTIDAMASVTATIGQGAPRVLVTAHVDEIGLCAHVIDDDGAVRIQRIGGVDPRILPGARVTVHTEKGPMPGVVGALAPYLQNVENAKKNYKLDDLFIDMGMAADAVKKIVHPGTQITLYGPLLKLENGRWASKTMDDRAAIAVMLRTAELLKSRKLPCQVQFVSASQEEVGGYGAATSAHRIMPDIAIAIDVTHGEVPGCEPDEVYPLDKVVLTEGPNIHPKLHKALMDIAKKQHIDAVTSICPHVTWTDASSLQIARSGVPTALVELPLKYMHTTVETLSSDVLEEAARLIAAFLESLDEGWEEMLCF